MSRIREKAALIIAIIALCLSVVNLSLAQGSTVQEEQNIQYVMFLGTNDKDTNEPVLSPNEAKAKVEDILVERFGSYTIQEANGGWDDNGTLYQEYTLVIYLSDTSLDEVRAAADDLLRVFNQKSILIQSNEVRTEFYYANG